MKKEEKTELTKERIISAAIAEFGGKGYRNGSINRICESGIPKGLLYHNFKNKDEVYLASMRRCFSDFAEYMVHRKVGVDMNAYFVARLDFISQNRDYVRIIFEAILQPPENLRSEIKEIKADFEALNHAIYAEALSKLTLREGVDKEEAFEYFELMQKMLNGHFGNMILSQKSIEEIVEEHEKLLPKLIRNMLYGIVDDKN